ncbi:hypothetical protein V2J09_014199 [Rumex salicifolius]
MGSNQELTNNNGSNNLRVPLPPPKPFVETLKSNLKETFFPDDPFRRFKKQPLRRRLLLGLQYFVPFLEWAPHYTFGFLRADLVAGITITSLAVPQGISYANLASLPPVIGLYSSFIPPLIYAMLGSSRDVAVGTVAVGSLLFSTMLGKVANPNHDVDEYVSLAFTATFFAGIIQASLGFLRLGFIVDLLSHATIVGFMAGAATVVCLQQLKGILGLTHFTHETDVVSVMRSVFTQTHMWRWESAVLGCCFLFFMLLTRFYSKKKPAFFWINAMAPLTSVILGSLLVYSTHAEKHGVQVIGHLKKGLNPLSVTKLAFGSPYLITAIKTGAVTGIIALAEGVAVGRSFAMFKNYHIDGNKEMIAFGLMNVAGSCTSCYLSSGPFSRSAVNFNAGCKTAASNIVMAMGVMITLMLLTPFFYYTPLVVLSSIIMTAMLGLIDFQAVLHLWKVDKYDFVTCVTAYLGVVFGSVETGLALAVILSLLRLVLFMARPKTTVLGSLSNSSEYRSSEQYRYVHKVPGALILQINGPVYFASSNYLRERILRWIAEEEDRIKSSGDATLQHVILDMSAVPSIDTSGISMLSEVKKTSDRKGLKLALANPGNEVMKKLFKSDFIETIGREWIHATVAEAVGACTFAFHMSKTNNMGTETDAQDSNQLQWPKSYCTKHVIDDAPAILSMQASTEHLLLETKTSTYTPCLPCCEQHIPVDHSLQIYEG